jgi:cardiolipin synthase C
VIIHHRNVQKNPFVLLMTLLISVVLVGCIHQKPLDLPPEEALPPGDSAFWQELAAIRADDWFYLLNTGNDALRWRLNMIDVATVSIDMDTFLWKPDTAGLRILAHLVAAADRGVRVRILLDDSFTMHEELELHAADEHPNISYRIYNPFRHRSDSAFWRELFNLGEFTRINHRMHNKTLIVDGRMALVGGRNLGDEYFGLHDNLNFRDMEVITAGSQVEAVTEQFDAFWNSGWAFPIDDIFDAPENAGSVDALRESLVDHVVPVMNRKQLQSDWLVLAKQALPGRAEFFFDEPADHNPADIAETPDQLAAELRELINSASSEVILVTAYLVPTPELETVVETVEARGVEVRVLTNSLRSNNHLAAHAAYSKHLHRLIGHGADLHEVRVTARDRELYMQQPVESKQLGLHAKVMLVDDQITFIGSCNLDPRSLKINTEVGLIIQSPELNQQLREQLKVDFLPENAWAVKSDGEGGLRWEGHDQVLKHQPADSLIQRLEDWFIGLLPIDKQM